MIDEEGKYMKKLILALSFLLAFGLSFSTIAAAAATVSKMIMFVSTGKTDFTIEILPIALPICFA